VHAPAFLPHLKGLRLETLTVADDNITIVAATIRRRSRCPACQRCSTRVHSHYWRTVADQPWGGRPVSIRLQARRFRCTNKACPQQIFVERLPALAPVAARRTPPLRAALEQLAFATGARPGAKVATALGMPLSARTLLRLLHASPCPSRPTPRVLGIDEWAWRRGQHFGTILVDLERGVPVDLLPDRDADSVAAWLRAHPQVEIVSRDRSALYADGIARGAPTACQVADRFHLLRSLRGALERLLDGQGAARRAALAPPAAAPTRVDTATASVPPSVPDTAAARETRRRRTRRLARFEEVRGLAAAGVSQTAIAAQLGMSHKTVKRYLRATTFPEWAAHGPHRSPLDSYKPYLRERWQAGCRNGRQLYREIRARGYARSRGPVARYITHLRRALPPGTAPSPDASAAPATRPAPSARRVARWFVRHPDRRTSSQEAYLARLRAAEPALAVAYALTQDFAVMLRDLQGERLTDWLAMADECALTELRSFAAGLRADEAAVRAGLTEPWSTGPVEGQITRLKLIKRQGYGRAGFALLRQRVLHVAD
jgi:transposase